MAQIRGFFPYPTAQLAEGGGVIALPSGGTWYPPPGEFLITCPANCAMQYWNPIAQNWVNYTGATTSVDYFSTDGANWRMINLTGIVQVASFTAGSAGTNGIGSASGATLVVSAPGTNGVQATGYVIVGGSVAAPTVTQAGSGFLVPPLLVADPPPLGGIQATATCALSGTPGATGSGIGVITMLNVGAGYAVTPNWWVIPQPAYYTGGPSGSPTTFLPAAGTPPPGLVFPANAVPGNQNTSPVGVQLTSVALTGSGTLTGVVMVNNGSLYTGTPTGTIAGGGLTSATVTMSAVTAAATTTAFAQPRVQ
jgi:hypothetical protein